MEKSPHRIGHGVTSKIGLWISPNIYILGDLVNTLEKHRLWIFFATYV